MVITHFFRQLVKTRQNFWFSITKDSGLPRILDPHNIYTTISLIRHADPVVVRSTADQEVPGSNPTMNNSRHKK